ncbi:MAG TPA: YidC/Oxa1 family membrane protein insertase [Ilumatobacteraceae bacterium]|nr:YidC/Oxa1 family membrane protein insertase [Ilumatobacteraceae bacterium]
MFEIPAALLSWFYGWTNNYTIAIALIAAVVMAITTPLTLKSTKGMLQMQRLAPEMRKLQNEYRNDRQKLNEEMMKLYQEHKVNPMASCLPLLAQAPVFYIMFRILQGLTYAPRGSARPVSDAVWGAFGNAAEVADPGFIPRYLSIDSALYRSLFGEHEMVSLGLDFSLSAARAVTEGFVTALPYVLLVVLLGVLYFVQQRMVAARASISPTMSPAQAKLMQYLPVAFAVFQVFFLAALVVYYIFQTLLRIAQQAYITRAFYGHDESLGRQAQRAGEAAREEAKKNGETGGFLAQAKRDLGGGSDAGKKSSGSAKPAAKDSAPAKPVASKRVTPPKNRPTPSAGAKGRPTPTRQQAQAEKAKAAKAAKSSRPKPSKKTN